MFARTVSLWSPFCYCRCTVFIGFRAPVLLQGKCGLPVVFLALHPLVNGGFALMILGNACIFLVSGKDYVQTVSGLAMQYVACRQACRDNIGAALWCGGSEVVGSYSQGVLPWGLDIGRISLTQAFRSLGFEWFWGSQLDTGLRNRRYRLLVTGVEPRHQHFMSYWFPVMKGFVVHSQIPPPCARYTESSRNAIKKEQLLFPHPVGGPQPLSNTGCFMPWHEMPCNTWRMRRSFR